ncbi:hypothetical protein [Rhodococcus zopfii]|nr:hypothetical protein [Rhodococcus zopfii]
MHAGKALAAVGDGRPDEVLELEEENHRAAIAERFTAVGADVLP